MVGHASIAYVLSKTIKLQTKRSINNKTLEKITKEEAKYLINLKILKLLHGNYGDSLVVTGKFGNARGKTRYITDSYYNYLLRLKLNDKNKQTIDDVKENQRYLFMDSMDNGNSTGTSNSVCVL